MVLWYAFHKVIIHLIIQRRYLAPLRWTEILYNEYDTLLVPKKVYFSSRFRAVYTVEDTACGGHLNSESGRFASPYFPDSYPQGKQWI